MITQQKNNEAQPLSPTGKWTDLRSGEEKIVKSMVDDMTGSAQIMFTDGLVIPFKEFSQFFIQSEETDDDSVSALPSPQSLQNQMSNNVSTNVSNNKLNTDLLLSGLGNGNVNTIYNSNNNFNNNKQPNEEHNEEHTDGYKIVEKFVNSLSPKPKLNIKLDLENIPVDVIKTMVMFLGVREDDIVDYFMEYFCNDNSFGDAIRGVVSGLVSDDLTNN